MHLSGVVGTHTHQTAKRVAGRYKSALLGFLLLPIFALANGPAELAPAKPGFTRLNVIGNLYVDVAGNYPEGYGGKWQNIGTQMQTPVTLTTYPGRGEVKPSRLTVILKNTEGSAGPMEFGFDNASGRICYGSLSGTEGPVVLTEVPRTFQLADLHLTVPDRISGCATRNPLIYNFATAVTLSADSQGNVTMQYVVDTYSTRGEHIYRRESPAYQFKNTMTPEMAAAEMAKKKQAAANAAAAAAAAQAQAEADAADRKRSEDILNSLPPDHGKK